MRNLIERIYRILNACKGFLQDTTLKHFPMVIFTLSMKARLTQ